MYENVVQKGWNPLGTNTWAMIDSKITSAVYDVHGVTTTVTSSAEDSIIGLPLVNNPERSFAKLVDVDPDQQQSPTIYGMDLGVNWSPNKEFHENSFIGEFHPTVITCDIWTRSVTFRSKLSTAGWITLCVFDLRIFDGVRFKIQQL